MPIVKIEDMSQKSIDRANAKFGEGNWQTVSVETDADWDLCGGRPGQNVQAHPTAPQADLTQNAEADRGSSGAASCSAAASSENRQLVESIGLTFETLNEKGEVVHSMTLNEKFMTRPDVLTILMNRSWHSAKHYNLELPSFRVFKGKPTSIAINCLEIITSHF